MSGPPRCGYVPGVAHNTVHVDAPPERVFAVLCDWRGYGYWVAGTRFTSGADPDWPRVGSAFSHQIGFGPLCLDDRTEVVAIDPPRRLELRIHLGPFGRLRTTLELEPEGDGTRLRLIELPDDVRTRLLAPVVIAGLHVRNFESSRRLKNLVELRDDLGAEVAAASAR